MYQPYVPSLLNLPPISLPIPPLQVDTEPLFEFPESYSKFGAIENCEAKKRDVLGLQNHQSLFNERTNCRDAEDTEADGV